MKDNEWVNQVVEELQSLPEPDYEKGFDINKQNKIHDNLVNFSRSFELKKRRRDLMNRITAGVASIAALLLFCFIFIPMGGDSDNATVPEIETLKEYFHQKMEEMHKQEKNYSYTLIHTELNVVQKDDAIVVFKENNNNGEQIYIAYFKNHDDQWEWKQTRGSDWNSPINWTSMNQKPYIYSGPLRDNAIKDIYVGGVQAKIIAIEGDKRFWYAISPVEEVEVVKVTEEGNKEIIEEVYKELDVDHTQMPKVSVEGIGFGVVRASFCGNNGCEEYGVVPDMLENRAAKRVSKGEKIKIEFDYGPKPSSISVSRMKKDQEWKKDELINDVLTAPQEKGIYYYEIYANWQSKDGSSLGDAYYAFVIRIQ